MRSLVLNNVIKQFGSVDAVAGVSMEVAAGERRVVIGPNGAGKTTLFHCIAGTLISTSGSIVHNNRDITRLTPNARARLGLARTFQITNLFSSLTLTENVMLSLAACETMGVRRFLKPMLNDRALRDRAANLLSDWGLAEHDRLVRHISYGEQRQLELAVALASRPELLLLDEPMAGLSAAESARVLKMIRALPREVSVLMIEHDMDVALQFADCVSVMHQGRVIAEGDSDTIRVNSQVAELYLGWE